MKKHRISISLTPLAKANLVARAREMTQTPAELAADIVTLAVNTMGIVSSAHTADEASPQQGSQK